MHPLLTLYKFQGKSLFRRMTRNIGTVKGALLFIFGIAVVILWISPSAYQAMHVKRTDPAVVIAIVPAIMLAMCLLNLITSGGVKAVVFTPAEVDFLFPAPFTRRQLLAYKLGKSLVGLLFSSVLLSVVFLRHAVSWPFAWWGTFLALIFMQLLAMAITLIAQSAGERAYTRSRKIILVAMLLIIAAAVIPSLKAGDGRLGFLKLAQAVHSSRIGSILLSPLEPFGRLFVASRWWPEGLIYSAAALGINGVLMLVVFYLDADYLEAAATKSQKVYERAQRLRKGGLSALAKPGKKGKWAIPKLPHLRGAGPIAWRQMTTALRNSRGLLFVLLILALTVGPIMFAPGNVENAGTSVISAFAFSTLIVGALLRFDFRGDLDLIDHLKSLPVSASAVSIGQLITPALMMSACHLIIIGSVALAIRKMDILLASAAILSLPFNVLLFGVENAMFLLFPTRAAANPADFQGYGRQILMLFVKGGVILVAALIAGGGGAMTHFLGAPASIAVAVAAILLSALALATIPIVAWAFKRFDVAGDVPA